FQYCDVGGRRRPRWVRATPNPQQTPDATPTNRLTRCPDGWAFLRGFHRWWDRLQESAPDPARRDDARVGASGDGALGRRTPAAATWRGGEDESTRRARQPMGHRPTLPPFARRDRGAVDRVGR